jgi:LysR family transcriptional regulator of gallate degradation
MELELRHLRAFLAVAEQGSANRAGAALYRAQSAVSRSIHKLEASLRVALFERRARGMLLTEYGRALLVRARRVQAEMLRARSDLAAAVDRGTIRNAAIFGMFAHERRVRAFVALSDQHHMPSVAKALGITQPAVSLGVRQMEDTIGTRLFERTARGMLPTPAGAALTLRLKRVLAEMRHAVADIDALRGVTQGLVTVGVLPLSRTRLLPEAIARVVARYPGLRVATVEGSFEALSASLRAGDIDFILGALRPAGFASDLQGEALAEDELAIVARAGHPLAARRVSTRELARARWVLPRANTPNRLLFERAMHTRGIAPPEVVVETSDLAVLRGVLLNGDLLAAISPRQLSYELEAGVITQLRFALPDTRRVIGITRRLDSLASPGARALMEEIGRRAPEILAPLARRHYIT